MRYTVPRPGVTDLSGAEWEHAVDDARRIIQEGNGDFAAVQYLELIWPSVPAEQIDQVIDRAQEQIDLYAEFLAGDVPSVSSGASRGRPGQISTWVYHVAVSTAVEGTDTVARCTDRIESDIELSSDELISRAFARLISSGAVNCQSPTIVQRTAAHGTTSIELLYVERSPI